MTDTRPGEPPVRTPDELALAADFPPASYEDWLAEVDKALKGAPFDKRMIHHAYDGIDIRPIYVESDWPAAGDPSGFPGFSPFTRGAHASGQRRSGWGIRQEHLTPDPARCNREILSDLERGTNSIALRLDDAARAGLDADDPAAAELAGRGGVMIYSVEDLDRALADVHLDIAPVTVIAGAQALPAAALLLALKERRGVDWSKLVGFLATDPIGALAGTGALPVPVGTAIAHAVDLAAYCTEAAPKLHAITVNTSPYHEAGASEVQDLAYGLATALAYLRAMTAAGMDIDQACRQIAFTIPVSCDQFASIAKLRAARRLWARVAEACGASAAGQTMLLHARSDDRMMTRYDPWVNMLRTTVAGFAAAVGGAQIVTLQTFDRALGPPDEFSLRLARNTQIMLHEESHLAQVVDAAGGSWFVESLTDDFVRHAWEAFQAIEAAGGIVATLMSGHIAEQIDATWSSRAKNLARRKDAITGVSEFPNIAEALIEHPQPDLARSRAEAGERLAALRRTADGGAAAGVEAAAGGAEPGALTRALIEAASKGATLGALAKALAGDPVTLPALPRRRLAGEYEQLRDASERCRETTGARPRIFLANLGPIAKHTARATFAKNFFETGGIEALGNDGFADADACAQAFTASGAQIAIICSADPIYESMVPEVAPALKAAGCRHLFLAGNPGDKRAIYDAAGVDDYIFLGGDVLATLEKTHGILGVSS